MCQYMAAWSHRRSRSFHLDHALSAWYMVEAAYDAIMPNRYSDTPAVAHGLPERVHHTVNTMPMTTPSTMPAACDQEFHSSSLWLKYILMIAVCMCSEYVSC